MATPLSALSHDELIDIMMFLHDDIKSVMNLAFTCSALHGAITECSERFWIYILENKFINRVGGGWKDKTKSLSILENDTGLSDRSKQLISIIRTQVRFDRKRQILKGYKKERDLVKYKYFRSLNIKDEYIWKLIKREQNESLNYSPENIIKEKFLNNPNYILSLSTHKHSFNIKELIDALFRKENAYLELDIHNRTISSYLYDFLKQNPRGNLKYFIINFKYKIASLCQDVDDAVLFIKLIYLEFPNSTHYLEENLETGYEQERHSKGSFKNVLLSLKQSYPHHPNILKALEIFENDLYGPVEEEEEASSIFSYYCNII